MEEMMDFSCLSLSVSQPVYADRYANANKPDGRRDNGLIQVKNLVCK